MMKQSNALGRLEEMLTEAVDSGDRNQAAGLILLEAMKLSNQPKNLLDFYELLSKAEEEARSIDEPDVSRYLQTIEELHEVFVVNHLWGTPWNTLAAHITNRNVLTTLHSLSYFFHLQNPTIFLEQDFLEKLNGEFRDLLNRILESDLSRKLKKLLVQRIKDILKAIHRYHTDGTEGLEKAAKSLVSDLVMAEHNFNDEDKNDPVYKRTKAWVFSLLMCIVSAVPDIDDYWVPKFEELATGREKVEKIICETLTIQEAFEKASNIFDEQQQKSIAGRGNVKALPASKEDLEATTSNKSDP